MLPSISITGFRIGISSFAQPFRLITGLEAVTSGVSYWFALHWLMVRYIVPDHRVIIGFCGAERMFPALTFGFVVGGISVSNDAAPVSKFGIAETATMINSIWSARSAIGIGKGRHTVLHGLQFFTFRFMSSRSSSVTTKPRTPLTSP